MRLLDLVEQDHRVRLTANLVGELPGVVVSDISGRCTDESGDVVLLLELAHVEADHPSLVAEDRCGKGFREFRLADAGRPEEEERSDRPVGIGESRPRSTHSLGHRGHGLVLSDHPVVQRVLEAEQFLALLSGQLRHRDSGLPRHHLGDVHDGHLWCRRLTRGTGTRALLVDLGLELVRALVVLVGDGRFLLAFETSDLLLELPCLGVWSLGTQPNSRTRLVDHIDRLVGHEPVGDVAVGQFRCGDERFLRVAHLVMFFVDVGEALENLDRVVHRRLGDHHRLEATFEGRILLDVLAVFVDRGRADGVQLASGERGLEHVARIHRTLAARPGADDGVQFVDEQDELVGVLPHLVEHLGKPLLELAAILRARDHRTHVERDHTSPCERRRDVAVDDALRETFDDRRLSDAGVADQHRVVLPTPREDLDGLLDLVVTAHHGIDVALPGLFGQIAPVLVERRGVRLRCGLGLRLAPFVDSRPALQHSRRGNVGRQHRDAEQHVLGPYVADVRTSRLLLRIAQRLPCRRTQTGTLVAGTAAVHRRDGLHL